MEIMDLRKKSLAFQMMSLDGITKFGEDHTMRDVTVSNLLRGQKIQSYPICFTDIFIGYNSSTW